MNLTFQEPNYFLFFFIVPFLIFFYFFLLTKINNQQLHSSLQFFKKIKPTWKNKIVHLPFWISLFIISLIIIALAKPQEKLGKSFNVKEGIDIMFVLDISISMNIQDFKPNRLEVAKKQIYDFLNIRENDRMGLVVFGEDAFLQSPLTFDKDFLQSSITRVDFLEEIKSSTAMGNAITTAILALKESETKSKIIILLTDGDSNAGEIDPITAANLAREYNIKIYSIGIGKPGKSIINQLFDDPLRGKIFRPIEVYMDETTLIKISEITQGKYFNVKNTVGFTAAYEEIDALEKTEVKETDYDIYKDYHPLIIKIILWLIIFYLLVKYIVINKKPV